MVRQGALASFIVILAACSPDVDDPANFTVGNTNATSASGSSTTAAEGTTEVADGSAGATSTTGGADTQGAVDSTTGGPDTGNTGNCGNGVIDAGEQCDGVDLQNFDCQSLGLNSGTLACDPMMCTFDTSMCSSTTGGTSG